MLSPKRVGGISVPTLTAEDMVVGELTGPDGKTACLAGWLIRLPNSDERRSIERNIYCLVDRGASIGSIMVYNDTHTHEENAALWNEAVDLACTDHAAEQVEEKELVPA